MIEYRAILTRDLAFDGGFKLEAGSIIYVRETEHGWLGMFYETKGSGHGFAPPEGSFSILTAYDTKSEELVVTPDPPDPPEKAEKERELARRRLESSIRRHEEEAERLSGLLAEM